MSGHTSGAVRLVLRIEGLVVLVTGVCAYARLGASWTTFALFYLAPDLSWLGYRTRPRGRLTHSIKATVVAASRLWEPTMNSGAS
jgi:hypothetical protein